MLGRKSKEKSVQEGLAGKYVKTSAPPPEVEIKNVWATDTKSKSKNRKSGSAMPTDNYFHSHMDPLSLRGSFTMTHQKPVLASTRSAPVLSAPAFMSQQPFYREEFYPSGGLLRRPEPTVSVTPRNQSYNDLQSYDEDNRNQHEILLSHHAER